MMGCVLSAIKQLTDHNTLHQARLRQHPQRSLLMVFQGVLHLHMTSVRPSLLLGVGTLAHIYWTIKVWDEERHIGLNRIKSLQDLNEEHKHQELVMKIGMCILDHLRLHGDLGIVNSGKSDECFMCHVILDFSFWLALIENIHETFF